LDLSASIISMYISEQPAWVALEASLRNIVRKEGNVR